MKRTSTSTRAAPSSVLPLEAMTSPALAMVRLHGRNGATWEARGVATVERYRYLYDQGELEAWAPTILAAARHAEHTHVLMNNCYGNYGTTNALEMTALLAEQAGQAGHPASAPGA